MTPCCYLVVKEEEELEMLRLYSDSQGLDLVHEIFDRSIVTCVVICKIQALMC